MKKLLLVVFGLTAPLAAGLAQGVDPLAPSALTPKPVRSEPAPPAQVTAPLHSPRPNPEGDKPINPDMPNLAIKGIVIVPSRSDIREDGVSGVTGVEVHDIPFLDGPEFRQTLQPFLNQPLTENRIRDLEDAIILFCRAQGRLLVDVILPEQNIENGVLQLWLLEGKVGRLTVKNEGRKWFQDAFIMESVRLLPEEPVNALTLNKDLNWLNSNPFRQVDAVFKPGDKLGQTDVELNVEDRLPLRVYGGYEDSGTEFTGPDRLFAGFNWGNAFGLDHQLNYQYQTDVDFDMVKAHSASYIVPLPWRHRLTVYGSYVEGKADFSPGGIPDTTGDGTSWQTSGRYAIPLADLRRYRHDVSGGFDFKRSNNNIDFGGATVNPSDTDLAQFALGYNGTLQDSWGRTMLNLEMFYSPGELTSQNSDADFDSLRAGSKAEYFYMRANLERLTRLPQSFFWWFNFWGQAATERLQPSEQIALGGYNTIRGYDERVLLGDKGWIMNNELRTPPLALGRWVRLPQLDDALQFLAFFDCGAAYVNDEVPEDNDPTEGVLCSVGAGLRYTVGKNFSLRFDYGFPLTEHHAPFKQETTGGIEQTHRGHVGVTLSY